METVANWGVRPVFITSTFQDMQAERDWLWDFVRPALEARLRARRRHLEWIDLRLGADTAQGATEAAREAQVLKVCLDEVRRSRPFLIALIGDRYGWVPPHDRAVAAAREAGIEGDVAGRSVTDLEIDFGVFHDPGQGRRSLFFLRDPLPLGLTDDRARFSDAVATDAGGPDRVARLAALKRRLVRSFPDRLHRYRATWKDGRVAGLEAFGQQVEAAVWAQLEADLSEEAAPADLSWQAQEARALDAFAADHRRDFQGRAALLAGITTFLAAPGDDWALCLTGAPGAGKSAVFAEVLAHQQAAPALVLAHAAGASPHGSSVDAMLRRWIGELAAFLNLPADADAETGNTEAIVQRFASLLGRASVLRRVVVLVDALDQFEPTPRGRFLTWLPTLWPPNARLFATAIAGDAPEALSRRPGARVRAMPSLTGAEARAVFAAIHARYHRAPDPAVLAALMQKPVEGWCNPLWLYLAVEQVNLLDEDDVALAERRYDPSWPMARRLQTLLLDRVAALPTDVPGLYRFTFDHAARRFPDLAEAFLGLLAVGAAGWRESDLRVALSILGLPWNDLRFARLRRLFRSQIQARGALEQWDVAHAQMRVAILGWRAARGLADLPLHVALATRLLGLPGDDPVRATETMRHLLGSRDLINAAWYYAKPDRPEPAASGETRFLAAAWLSDAFTPPVQDDIAAMLALPDVPGEVIGMLAHRLLFDLHDAIAAAGRLPKVMDLLQLLLPVFTRLAAQTPEFFLWQRGLSVCHERIGDVLLDQGRFADALDAYRNAYAIRRRLAARDAGLSTPQRDLFVSLKKIGRVLRAQGDRAAALDAVHGAMEVARGLVAIEPGNADWQHDLATCHMDIGSGLLAQGRLPEALAAFQDAMALNGKCAAADPDNAVLQFSLSNCHAYIGDVHYARDALPEALSAFRGALALASRLATEDPGNARLQRGLAIRHDEIGDTLFVQGDFAEALAAFRTAQGLFQGLVARDQANDTWRRDLVGSDARVAAATEALQPGKDPGSVSSRKAKVASLRASGNNFSEIMKAFVQGHLAELERLAAAEPDNSKHQQDLAAAHGHVGDLLTQESRFPEALEAYRRALALRLRLARAEPGNAAWQGDLAKAHEPIGDALAAQKDFPGAIQALREGTAIRRRLAEGDRANVEWQRDLAWALQKLGNALGTQGDRLAAVAAFGDGLAVTRRIAAAMPDDFRAQWDLSLAYDRFGDVLASHGDTAGATKAFDQSLACIEKMANSRGSIATSLPMLSRALESAGDKLFEDGELPKALRAFRHCRAVREGLAQAAPGDAGCQGDVAAAFGKIADVLLAQENVAQENVAEAVTALRASLAIAERLAGADPEDEDRQRNVSAAWYRIGGALAAQDNLAGALEAFRADLTIAIRLARAAPDDPGRKHDLWMSYDKVGETLATQGDMPGALDAFSHSLDIVGGMVRAQPDNADWQQILWGAYRPVTEVLVALCRLSEALQLQRQRLAFARRNAAADPASTFWQENLATSHEHIAKVLQAQGDAAGSIAELKTTLALRERLAQADPDDEDTQRNVAVSHFLIAEGLLAAAMAGEARAHAEAAESLVYDCVSRFSASRRSDEDLADIADLRRRIEAALSAPAGGPGQAHAAAVQSLRRGHAGEAIDLLRPALLPDGARVPSDTTPDNWIVTYATALALAGDPRSADRALEWVKDRGDTGAGRLRAALAAWRKSLTWTEGARFRLGGTLPRPVVLDYPPGEL